jgi:hypothetical protein
MKHLTPLSSQKQELWGSTSLMTLITILPLYAIFCLSVSCPEDHVEDRPERRVCLVSTVPGNTIRKSNSPIKDDKH